MTIGKWITEPAGYTACVCQAVLGRGLIGCRGSLGTTFFQVGDLCGSLLCIACTKKHFGFGPIVGVDIAHPPKEPLTECGHAADDKACMCWGVRIIGKRFGGGDCWSNGWMDHKQGLADVGCLVRANAAAATLRTGFHEYCDRYEVRRFAAPDVTPAAPPPPAAQATPKPCALPWCERTTTDGQKYHDARCAEYGARVDKIVATRDAFIARLTAKGTASGEAQWAREQAEREIAPIRIQWKALLLDRPAHEPDGG